MDMEIFVQNVKKYCALRGIKPTVACRESGVSTSFLTNIESKGSIPSVEKVQLLAQYLDVSTSELLGERPPSVPAFPEHPDLVLLYDRLSETAQREVMEFVEFKAMQETKAVKGSVSVKTVGDTCPARVKEMNEQKAKEKK